MAPGLGPQSSANFGSASYLSSNWAGYAAETDLSSPLSGAVTYVSGSWTVPAVTASPRAAGNDSDCSAWVGIDGFSNGTVEQLGTDSYVLANGSIGYYAWYEMYPAASVFKFYVGPGDSITASVQYDAPGHSGFYQLSLTDNTSHTGFTVYEPSSTAQRTSAEWIVERRRTPAASCPCQLLAA